LLNFGHEKSSVLLPLSQLPFHIPARVVRFDDEEIGLRLIEMGCIPGTEIVVLRKAPLGDPLAFSCRGSIISIRSREAQQVMVEECNG
jgi:ferrous iron transport protein A